MRTICFFFIFLGWSPIHEACNRGNLSVVRILVQYGADLNSLGDGRETPLHDASRNGHLKVSFSIDGAQYCL